MEGFSKRKAHPGPGGPQRLDKINRLGGAIRNSFLNPALPLESFPSDYRAMILLAPSKTIAPPTAPPPIAKARPSMVAPVFKVIEVYANKVPAKIELVPRVALLPTCQ